MEAEGTFATAHPEWRDLVIEVAVTVFTDKTQAEAYAEADRWAKSIIDRPDIVQVALKVREA